MHLEPHGDFGLLEQLCIHVTPSPAPGGFSSPSKQSQAENRMGLEDAPQELQVTQGPCDSSWITPQICLCWVPECVSVPLGFHPRGEEGMSAETFKYEEWTGGCLQRKTKQNWDANCTGHWGVTPGPEEKALQSYWQSLKKRMWHGELHPPRASRETHAYWKSSGFQWSCQQTFSQRTSLLTTSEWHVGEQRVISLVALGVASTLGVCKALWEWHMEEWGHQIPQRPESVKMEPGMFIPSTLLWKPRSSFRNHHNHNYFSFVFFCLQ